MVGFVIWIVGLILTIKAALNPRFWDKSQVTDEVLAEEKKIALALMDTDPKMASKPCLLYTSPGGHQGRGCPLRPVLRQRPLAGRHDDDCRGIPCEIAPFIMVNHWGDPVAFAALCEIAKKA